MILYHHLEIFARELDAKLWVAARSAFVEGHESLICNYGSFIELTSRNLLPPGLFLTKSLTPKASRVTLLDRLSEKGFLIASQDEESGLTMDDYSSFALGRFGDSSLKRASAVFCWGRQDQSFLQAHYSSQKEKFFAVGSPRVDLWLPSMAGCWQRPGAVNNSRPFILVPFNFGLPVGTKSLAEVIDQARKAGYFDRDTEHEEYLYRLISENALILHQFVVAVLAMADAFPRLTLSFDLTLPKTSAKSACYFQSVLI